MIPHTTFVKIRATSPCREILSDISHVHALETTMVGYPVCLVLRKFLGRWMDCHFSGPLKYFSLSGKIVNNPCIPMTGRLLGFIGVVQREKRTQK